MKTLKAAPFVLAIAVALAGCASTPPVAQSPTELHATHGFVIATLPSMDESDSLMLRAVDTGNTYTLQHKPEYGLYAVGIWLPQGSYEIADVTSKNTSKDGTGIAIQAGRITDLGAVARFEIGGYASVRVPVSHTEARMVVQSASQALRSYLVTSEAIEWRPTARLPEQKQESTYTGLGLVADLLLMYDRSVNEPPINKRLEAAKTNEDLYRIALTTLPPRTDKVASDTKGNLYYGADFGQLRVRHPDGRWDSIDTGTIQSISAVDIDNAHIIVGTNHGIVRQSDDHGKTWLTLAQLPSSETVISIDHVGPRWIVTTAPLVLIRGQQTTNSIKVYAATTPDLKDLALLRNVPLSRQFYVRPDMLPRVQTFHHFYYVSAIGEMLRLEVPTMQWSSLKAPNDVLLFNVSPKTGTITSFLPQGAFSKLSSSSDNGETWQKRNTPPYSIYDVQYETPEHGRATRWNAGAFTVTTEFLEYDAKQDAWIKKYEAPPGCKRLLRDAERRQRFCVTSGGSILDYVDGQWKVESGVN